MLLIALYHAMCVSTPKDLRYLALGDSYTIGESVPATDRWPIQLAELLRKKGFRIEEPVVLAKTGWTTAELQEAIRGKNDRSEYDLVSLLIGVNNQYRGQSLDIYRKEFKQLLATAAGFADGKHGRVIVLSIPDWGVMPFAKGRDRRAIASEIARFNKGCREESVAFGARFVDITELADKAGIDTSLQAADGLHYSRKMYAEWAQAALSEAMKALKD